MLHILGIILKIIGILLLVLLGLILAIILAVLFVPVGYKLQGEKSAKEISGKASVYWLFHLIHVRIQYLDKKMNPEIYIFGIPILSVRRKLQERKTAAGKKDAVSGKNAAENKKVTEKKLAIEKKTEIRRTAEEKETSKSETVKSSAMSRTDEAVQKVGSEQTGKIAEAEETVESEKVIKKENFLVKIFRSIKSCFISILRIPQKIIGRFRKIQLTIKGICDKIRRWKEFVTLDTTKRALQFLLGRGIAILKHILPKRMKGNLIYGFDDPALTGQLLGAFAVFYPIYRNRLQITPVFDHAVLEGKLELKGRIFTVYLAVQALQILIQKDVRTTYKRLQNKEA